MATKKGIGLYILCYLLIILLVALGLYSYSEGFASKKAPDFCGTYGYTEKDITNPKKIADVRKYTKSDCDALGGVLRYGWECLKVVKKRKNKKKDEEEGDEEEDAPIDEKDIKKNYSKACVALNSQDTPQPSECGGIGRSNLPFTITLDDKLVKVKANMFMVYTQDECETQLGGTFTSFQDLAERTKTPIKQFKKAAKPVSDEDLGVCGPGENAKMEFSSACTGAASLLNTGGGAMSIWDKILAFFK